MIKKLKSSRIESIDILRGLVMVLMALDHVRDYFHLGAIVSDPLDLETTTPLLFLTRYITHFCAPVFVFLTGTSASLYGQSRSKKQLSRFLFTRGLWLIFVEIVIMNFLWWFDPEYSFINLQVIWAIGLCMIFLSVLIYLPYKWLLILALVIVFGHNSLDSISTSGYSFTSILWYIFHQQQFLPVGESRMIGFFYPVLPWIGVMALGYNFGFLYRKGFDPVIRKRYLIFLGISTITLFLLIRFINVYGDPEPWHKQKNFLFTWFSFMNVNKYPPSLLYILITIGPTFLVLSLIENLKSKITDVLVVFGRVPFFYYVLHVFLIHTAALLTLIALGKDWKLMIFDQASFTTNKMVNYGYSLGVVYLVWVLIVGILYPLCHKYMRYKLGNPKKWWLSYL
ncbi:heparan-alpha-glucosaminide N-acetyltransferase domain-containing protein [Lutimonas saemankumensis]|uniref:DUF1624 domain-containing protein n=1 Tax=Lutimonas saemankumensis TaxID=483016 RepID=UPI001CD1C6F9|nr:heparan-alpha-glucosaminide N-acetyltransferase domain-containing protein [Lutimonas saemankumensis]MCA0933410.1 heparan-alpha-glucosaminide N-acetyltransferase domain-containing protein [Lutimonas saemankumensis]